jgi:hypothetical protein
MRPGINTLRLAAFHQFDDCFSFAAKWKKVSRLEDPMEKYKLIWTKYTTYLLSKEEPTNSRLYAWTHNLALPYISKHEHHFHLASVYNIEDTIGDELPRKITHPLQTTWTVIGQKKKKSPPTSPVQTKTFKQTTLNIDNTKNTLELSNINHPKQWKLAETATKKKRTHSQTTNESPNRNQNKPNKTTQQPLAHMTNALTLISKHMRRGTTKLIPPHTLKGTPPQENVKLIDPDKTADKAQTIDENSTPLQMEFVEPMQIDTDDSHIAHTQPTTNNTTTGITNAEPTLTSTAPVNNPYAQTTQKNTDNTEEMTAETTYPKGPRPIKTIHCLKDNQCNRQCIPKPRRSSQLTTDSTDSESNGLPATSTS